MLPAPPAPVKTGAPAASLVAKPKITAMVASESVMPMEPITSNGLRPTRSMVEIATNVVRILITEEITLMMNALDALNPTAFHKVVE